MTITIPTLAWVIPLVLLVCGLWGYWTWKLLSTAIPNLMGIFWFIKKFGLRTWLRYRRAYRDGVVIDYAEIFTPEELAVIGERFVPAPWEQPR